MAGEHHLAEVGVAIERRATDVGAAGEPRPAEVDGAREPRLTEVGVTGEVRLAEVVFPDECARPTARVVRERIEQGLEQCLGEDDSASVERIAAPEPLHLPLPLIRRQVGEAMVALHWSSIAVGTPVWH